MKRIFFGVIALLLFVGEATSVQGARKKDNGRYVVVVSLDGFRWDYASRAHTPTLDSLRRVGTYAEIYPCFPSNTFPNHYSMATGLHPDHHGIVNNTFYDKVRDKWFTISNDDAVVDPGFWRGEPIWNTAERQGLRTATFMWVGCQTAIGGRQASRWEPFNGDVTFRQRADWVLGELTKPEGEIPRLIMWYLDEPDHTGHEASPDSPEVLAVAEQIDSLLTYFFREARRSPVFDRIDFIVTADHGMASLSPDRLVNLYPLLDNSRMRNVVNSNPLYLEPEPSYVDEACRIISAQPHMRVLRREAFPKEYHYGSDTTRIMPLVVLPDVGWTVVCREKPYPPLAGNHGFDPFSKEMHMIFYGSGPDFRVGYTQPSFQNLNLHAIIARLLGIEPAQPNDCDPKSFKRMLRR